MKLLELFCTICQRIKTFYYTLHGCPMHYTLTDAIFDHNPQPPDRATKRENMWHHHVAKREKYQCGKLCGER